jgi:peptidoglycan/LPS O-acetylase OafA/YrhL
METLMIAGANATDKGERQLGGRFYMPALDGIRAIAFLMVVAGHGIWQFATVMPFAGGFGVVIFFFLSGYLITTLLRIEAEKKNTISLGRFYLRRARRILPPLYITLILAYIVGHLRLTESAGTLEGFFSATFYYYNYLLLFRPHAELLPMGMLVVWSLMIEEHFYLVFPFLYRSFCVHKVARKQQVRILLVLCVAPLIWRLVVAFVLHNSIVSVPGWTYYATDTRFDSILWGCVMAIAWNPWFHDEAGWLDRWKAPLAALGLLVVTGELLIRNVTFQETVGYTIRSLCLLAMFYFVLSTRTVWTKCLEWRVLREIGQLSYSMYLVHEMVRHALGMRFHRSVEVMLLVIVLTGLYGFAMRWAVENPLRRLVT